MKWIRLSAVLCVAACCLAFAGSAWAVKYVSLGDSYSSGTGTRTYYDIGLPALGHVISVPAAQRAPDLDLRPRRLLGGEDRRRDQHPGRPASTADTNWVTYTIGGNDAGFSSVITECALPSWASNCDGAINTAQAYITEHAARPARPGQQHDQVECAERQGDRARLPAPVQRRPTATRSPSSAAARMTRLNQTADLLKNELSAAATRAGANFVFRDVIPLVRRPRGLRRWRRFLDRVDQRPLQPDRGELPPEDRPDTPAVTTRWSKASPARR